MVDHVIIEQKQENEIWLPIQGYESYYQISNLGKVKSLAKTVSIGMGRFQIYHERIRVSSPASNGYLMIRLQAERIGKSFTIHRLVANHFIPNPHNLSVINHIDGNKLNCRASNLEWTTHSANAFHAYKIGLKKQRSGSGNHLAKPIFQLDKTGNVIKLWGSTKEAADTLGIRTQGIIDASGKRAPHYKGFIWKKQSEWQSRY